MRVFISSVIEGFEAYREAAAEGIESLGYAVVRAEDFGARTDTPQRACLEAAREADLTVVLLGERYGAKQESGLSATHEEFREAYEHGTVAVFVQGGIDPEPDQAELIEEAQAWARGRFTDTFSDAPELRAKVTRLLHRYALDREARPSDPLDLVTRARERLPRHPQRSSSLLRVVVAGGPRREVLPPGKFEDPAFGRHVTEKALFGEHAIFRPEEGTHPRETQGRLRLEQESAAVEIGADGTVSVELPAITRHPERRWTLPALVEEDVRDCLHVGIGFIAEVMEEVDHLHRLSEVVVLAAIEGSSGLGWMTREERRANPNQVSISMRGEDLLVVPDSPQVRRRAELTARRSQIVDDLLVRLRRKMRS